MYSIFGVCVYMWVYGMCVYVGVYILDVEMYKYGYMYMNVYMCLA